jgi:hypothetical protein
LPSQVPGPVSLAPAQVGSLHGVLAAYLRQPPLPSQKPSVSQLAAPLSAHWLSGSAPSGTAMQEPSLPGTPHDMQRPLQVPVQQKPCWHEPDRQSSAVLHLAPMGALPHLPLVQTLGKTQSPSFVHVTGHCVPVPLASHM